MTLMVWNGGCVSRDDDGQLLLEYRQDVAPFGWLMERPAGNPADTITELMATGRATYRPKGWAPNTGL